MFTAVLSFALAVIGLTGVHGLALDRFPLSSHSTRDLLMRFPFALEQDQSISHRSPFSHSFYNTTSITSPPSNSKFKRAPTPTNDAPDDKPTPAPTGDPNSLTTVHITDEQDFALLLPKTPHELISDAETDGVSYCSKPGCDNTFPDGFITGSVVQKADDGSWIQITGCFNSALYPFADNDDGGQFDVRFPNGAQCTFGGYEASFIEQLEPSASRFCLRCCSSPNDQTNCNSHQDQAGCLVAVPGVYEFGDVDCSGGGD